MVSCSTNIQHKGDSWPPGQTISLTCATSLCKFSELNVKFQRLIVFLLVNKLNGRASYIFAYKNCGFLDGERSNGCIEGFGYSPHSPNIFVDVLNGLITIQRKKPFINQCETLHIFLKPLKRWLISHMFCIETSRQ